MTNKIMIAVDLQEDFVDGVLGSEAAQKIIPTAADAIRNFDGHTIFYTLDTHEQPFYNASIEGQRIPFHCPYKEDGWFLNLAIMTALGLYENNGGYIEGIEKDTFGSSLELVAAIRERMEEKPVEEIVLLGLCTDICVISNALILRAEFPNIKITVLSDACAGTSDFNHEAALAVMRANCIDVVGN